MNKILLKDKFSPFIVGIAFFVLVNVVASYLYIRLDLTAEKRYTLASNSKKLLKDLKHPLHIKLYLSGDLNSGFRLLSKNSVEMFDEMEVFSGTNLRYDVIDPTSGSESDRVSLIKELKTRGMEPIPVFETLDDGSKKQTLVYPYFIIALGDKELVVNLLENIPGLSGADNLNKSTETLEFKVVDAIRRLTTETKPRIAFLEGHGELDDYEVVDVTHELSRYYKVERGAIQMDASILNNYKCVIIASPKKAFSEKDKFVLNQYVMQGGNLLWLVDGVSLSLDSLQHTPTSVGMPLELNTEDILFKYGFRINGIAIEDIQCAMIPVNVASLTDAPKFVPAPWYYSPLLLPAQNNSITKNINVVKGEFTSSLDTVGDELGLKRKVLLASSRFSKISKAPVVVSLVKINEAPKKEEFTKSFIPVAVVAEGEFPSSFEFRAVPAGLQNCTPAVTKGKFAKMIVVADGDIIRNGVRFKDSQPQIVPLGYDEISHQTFGNKSFIVNSVNYLCDDMGWMELRNRNNVLRLLDKAKVAESAMFYKLLNVILPIILLIISGIVVSIMRKR